jgi:hypothetical protein
MLWAGKTKSAIALASATLDVLLTIARRNRQVRAPESSGRATHSPCSGFSPFGGPQPVVASKPLPAS